MRNVVFSVSLVLASVVAVVANAAPIVTMTQTAIESYNALDFFYSSSDGAEFTNYRLNVVTTNGDLILDPVKSQTQNGESIAVDTFMNTVGSFLGAGNASYNFNAYTPTGFGSDDPPVSQIDWSVFDTLEGDNNDPLGNGSRVAPFHLARVLVDPTAEGTAIFTAFDTAAPGEGAVFEFPFPGGEIIPVVDDLGPLNIDVIGGTATGTVMGIDVATWSPTLTALDYTPGFGAGPNAVDQRGAATFNTDTQEFSWSAVGAFPGTYTWEVSGSNGANSDTGLITVNLRIPEPGTLTLFGLAMVGFAGVARRRS